MERQPKITEVSVSFKVGKRPKTPVSSAAPFVVDRTGKNTERVVPVGTDIESIPEWVLSSKPGYSRFVYASRMQDLECVFKESECTLTIHGIKYGNLESFYGVQNNEESDLSRILSLLDTTVVGRPKTMYKATMTLGIKAAWNKDLIADVITNDPGVSQTAAVSERVSTLGSRRLFSVSAVADNGCETIRTPARREYARVTLRRDDIDSRKVIATMSRLPSADASVQVASTIEGIFRAYFREHANTPEKAPAPLSIRFAHLSGIKHLRSELPELFVNNYTRECPVLPIMISREQAELLEDVQRVIFYPIDSPMGRYYTAPKGYFVGLKRNRLENRETFPCLVTCYLHDHMVRKGSETYTYYTGANIANKSKHARPVPRSMGYNTFAIGKGFGYDRRRARSFVCAVEMATGRNIDSEYLPWCPQVSKQEMWSMSDDDIMANIRSSDCKPSAYRYFEELLEVSIHVVVIKNGIFESLVPSSTGAHSSGNDAYIWAPPYRQHVIVFETIKKTYGKTVVLYDILVRSGNVAVFDDDEPAVASIVAQKAAKSVPPPDIEDAVKQLIDSRGKCRMIVTSGGDRVQTFTRPLTVPVLPEAVCFFDSHTNKMNDIKQNMGLSTTDLYKRSTNNVLYFPNDSSFFYWTRMNAGSGTD